MKEKTSYELKETICRYLDDMAGKDLTPTTLDQIHKLSDTLKNILKIEMLEEVSDDYGNSERGYSNRRYSRDYSGRDSEGDYSGRRHYVRGHYSYADDDMSHYGRGGRYSYAEAKDDIIEQMHDIAKMADGKDRETIMRCIKQMQDA